MTSARGWLAVLGCALAACAPAAPAERPAGAPRAVEDAIPGLFAEEEVDVPARPLAAIAPAYPPALRALGIEGEVAARVAVLADGRVAGAKLLASSHAGFTEAAREAIAGARFEPALRGGRPVPAWVTVRLRFELAE